ncbi:unnamed protein product [Anisakis simplex]|uniref:Uncharacterized protein n=1 Tax=Anisakis simplex TaxID=6269 RepID=A0A0M3KEF5_ANISI|nr:unnamed protein product [Anisakis simplex]
MDGWMDSREMAKIQENRDIASSAAVAAAAAISRGTGAGAGAGVEGVEGAGVEGLGLGLGLAATIVSCLRLAGWRGNKQQHIEPSTRDIKEEEEVDSVIVRIV